MGDQIQRVAHTSTPNQAAEGKSREEKKVDLRYKHGVCSRRIGERNSKGQEASCVFSPAWGEWAHYQR